MILRHTIILTWFVMATALAADAGTNESRWTEPSHRRRVRLELPASPKGTGTFALSFTGEDFFRWTGFPRPPVASLRLWRKGARLAMQVEQRDGAGEILTKANGVLDDDDRVYCAVPAAVKAVAIYIYYDAPTAKTVSYAPAIPPKRDKKKPYGVTLSAGGLTIGVRGGGLGAGVKKRRNFGRAALCLFEWRGQPLADIQRGWLNYFPRATASSMDGPLWSEPEVIAAGPVRTVLRLRCKGVRFVKNGKPYLTGDITRTFALWAACPVVDVTETVRYKATSFEHEWPYGMTIVTGKALDTDDMLLVPLAGKPRAWPILPDLATYKKTPYHNVYITDNPEEGWLGWIDLKEKIGLATFYEKLPAIEARRRWVTYRPALHPSVYVRTNPNGRLEVRLKIRDRALRCRGRYQRELRYVGLHEESPEAVKMLYQTWSLPLDRFAKINCESSP